VLALLILTAETRTRALQIGAGAYSSPMFPLLLGTVVGSGNRGRKSNTPEGPLQVPAVPVGSEYPKAGWERPPGYPANEPWPPPPPPPGFAEAPPEQPDAVAVCGTCGGQVALEASQCTHCGALFETAPLP